MVEFLYFQQLFICFGMPGTSMRNIAGLTINRTSIFQNTDLHFADEEGNGALGKRIQTSESIQNDP